MDRRCEKSGTTTRMSLFVQLCCQHPLLGGWYGTGYSLELLASLAKVMITVRSERAHVILELQQVLLG